MPAKGPYRHKTPESLAERVQKCIQARERGKKMYKRSDELLKTLLQEVEPGQVIPLNEQGKKAVIVDKWAGKTQVVSIAFARRYEIEVTDS